MKWSSGEWEQEVARLVNQCADKVILELEEKIMMRLREVGEVVIQGLFEVSDKTVIAGINQPEDTVKKDPASQEQIQDINNYYVNGVCALSRTDSTACTAEEVWYAFGIIEVNQESTINLLGMEDRPCQVIGKGNLGMLVCPVPLHEYNEESLHVNMEDMAWVESHARRHEKILLYTMEERPVIPLPFCTIFTCAENIKGQLTQNSEKIIEDLQRLGNHTEMQVRLLVDHKRLLEKLSEDIPYTGGQGGGAYFQRRQWEKKIDQEMEQVMNDYGESLYQDLNNVSTELILLNKSRVIAPEGQDVVFEVQCLVDHNNREIWDKKLAEFDEIADPLGFILDVSGPWPPYHFVRLINEEEAMGG